MERLVFLLAGTIVLTFPPYGRLAIPSVGRMGTHHGLALLFLLMRRKAAPNYPFFTAYLITAIFQSAAVAALQRFTGLDRYVAWDIAWGTQAVVTAMRLVELTRKILSTYLGIWALAWRLLLGVGIVVLIYALAFSRGQFEWLVLSAVRGFELASAAVIVVMLLFARYYSLSLRRLRAPWRSVSACTVPFM